jgi:hypothetical protein
MKAEDTDIFDASRRHNIFQDFNHRRIRGAFTEPASNPFWYIFMTAPSCNMAGQNIENVPYLKHLNQEEVGSDEKKTSGKEILEALSFGVTPNSNQNVIKIITNAASSFSPADTQSQIIDYGETWTKLKHAYMGEDNDSRSGGTFNIEYSDFQGLPVLKLHKAWYEYIQGARRGLLSPADLFRKKRAVDFQASLYYFLLRADGSTIDYWAKYTGIFPNMVPYSSLASNDGSQIKFSITYNFMYKEDLEPEILQDFNLAVNSTADRVKNPEEWTNRKKDILTPLLAPANLAQRALRSGTDWLTGFFKKEEDVSFGDHVERSLNTKYFPESDTDFENGRFGSSDVCVQLKAFGTEGRRPMLLFRNKVK